MSWEDAADDDDAWEVNELPADTAAPAAPPTDDGAEWTSAVATPAPAPAPAPVVDDKPLILVNFTKLSNEAPSNGKIHNWFSLRSLDSTPIRPERATTPRRSPRWRNRSAADYDSATPPTRSSSRRATSAPPARRAGARRSPSYERRGPASSSRTRLSTKLTTFYDRTNQEATPEERDAHGRVVDDALVREPPRGGLPHKMVDAGARRPAL